VVDGCLEKHLRRRVGVVCWEGEGEFEGESGVGCVGWAEQCGVPVGEVGGREGGDAGCGRGHEAHELGLETVGGDCKLFGLLGGTGGGVCGGGVPFDDIAVGWSGGLGALDCGGSGGGVHGVDV
jgi:hypothetical protein